MCETHGDNMMEVKQRLDAKCWKGKHKEGTKIKGGIRVNNCVPNEGVSEGLISSGDAALELLELNIFKDLIGEHSLSNYDEEFAQSPRWQKVVAKWAPKAEGLYNAVIRLHNLGKKISSQEARAITDTAYDGSDAYNDPESAASDLPRIYAQQYNAILQFIENLSNPKPNTIHEQGVAEGGPFSYGKPLRKGSVADLAAKHRKEQDRKTPPIEPKDQMVGNAKVIKNVKEGQAHKSLIDAIVNKFDNITRLVQYDQALESTKYKIVERFFKKYGYPFELFNDVIIAIEKRIDGETNRFSEQGVDETQLAELDRPSGKLFIVVKADNAGATHVFGDFGSFPQDVMHKISKRGTRDKSGAKTKLKIDFLFDDFRSTIQQLRTIFRDVDFVGAEAAEFIIHSSALKSDQGEDVKHLRDYIEAGDDRRMKMYQKPEEDDEEDDGETTGGSMLRIDPETGAARKVVGVKPQTQMGGKSAEQPGMTTYRFKDPRFAQQLRGMNLGFNIKGVSITVDQAQKAKLVSMLGNKFGDIFTSQERFKEENTELNEKAVSQQQQKFFGMVHAMQKGKKIPGASAELKKTAKSMSKGDAKDFAKTRHAGLPKKVSEGGITLPNPDGTYPSGAWTPEKQRELNQSMAAQQGSAPLKGSAASQDALKAAMAQANQPKGTDKDLGNGFTSTTTKFNGQNVPAVLDTQDNGYWIEKPEGTGRQYGMAPYLKIQNGKIEGKFPGDQTAAAMKAAGWAIPERAPARPSSKPANQMSDEELEAELARRKANRNTQPTTPAPTNEDSYMESLSAALEQKLSVNDTPEVWRDDFEHADPVKYPQFRNKTVEKKHRMADVARYRQIQKK